MNAYICHACLCLIDHDRFPGATYTDPHSGTVVALCPDDDEMFRELGRIQVAPQKHETHNVDGD